MATLLRPAEDYYAEHPNDKCWKAYVDLNLANGLRPQRHSSDWDIFWSGWIAYERHSLERSDDEKEGN